jgi:hypothetical protein
MDRLIVQAQAAVAVERDDRARIADVLGGLGCGKIERDALLKHRRRRASR